MIIFIKQNSKQIFKDNCVQVKKVKFVLVYLTTNL